MPLPVTEHLTDTTLILPVFHSMTEDEHRRAEKTLQDLTDRYVSSVDALLGNKETLFAISVIVIVPGLISLLLFASILVAHQMGWIESTGVPILRNTPR